MILIAIPVHQLLKILVMSAIQVIIGLWIIHVHYVALLLHRAMSVAWFQAIYNAPPVLLTIILLRPLPAQLVPATPLNASSVTPYLWVTFAATTAQTPIISVMYRQEHAVYAM